MQIPKKLKEMGVVGAGGAGFPTYAKLKQGGIDHFIANGAECEPLLYVSKELMERFPDKVLKGLHALKNYTKAPTATIALKRKYASVVKALSESLRENNLDIDIFEMDDYFPAGDEQVLVYDLMKRVVPEGGIPLMVGAIVNNIETLYNVYNALEEDLPVTEKFITVGGDVENPITLKVPVGTKIRWALEFLGIEYENKIILDGGPMMGNIVEPDFPITKTTGGLLLFPEGHPAVKVKYSSLAHIWKMARISCIQCRYCTEQCPRYLLGHDLQPSKIMLSVGFNLSNNYIKQALLCCECGVCEIYSCPVELSPRRVNAEIKKVFAEKKMNYRTDKKDFAPREAREWRKIPMDRLKARLQIIPYDKYAYLVDGEFANPSEVHIMLKQHIGAPAIPVVEMGQGVEKGQVIGKIPEDKLGAYIHSSINGTIVDINEEKIVIRGGESS